MTIDHIGGVTATDRLFDQQPVKVEQRHRDAAMSMLNHAFRNAPDNCMEDVELDDIAIAFARFERAHTPQPVQADGLREATCFLCAGECRGHSLGRPEQWEPEPGSLAALAQPAPAPSGIDTETAAWTWLNKQFGSGNDDPVDIAYSADQMVDAFHAGHAGRAPAPSDADLRGLVEPWADHHGPLPDYDHPLSCVFDSGVQYAVELLAKELGVEDWTPCDGREEYDGDLGGTVMNIVRASLPADEHGEQMWPSDVHARLSSAPDAQAVGRARGMCERAADRATHMLDREVSYWRPTRAHYEGLRNVLRNAASELGTLPSEHGERK